MGTTNQRTVDRKRRARRIRKKVFGTAERPRLCVRRSLRHIYAQIVDDEAQRSLVQVGSSSKEVAEKVASAKASNATEVSRVVGELIAVRAGEKGIGTVVLDRKGYKYHGRVKALAESARGNGLVF